ncbi:hypothetical protein DXG03_002353 [Asterophora parasitica]|uniref:Endonuclease/exonuclease/phosphatase domain-containing protein n=1 Tax=Asterophora parasitica TaxID=117018 RepID=A0A9P7G2F8_9AGAR|nr:hypothetical protein DXG03_002353 [Asterophora parasitica]
MNWVYLLSFVTTCLAAAAKAPAPTGPTIADIQGPGFQSPLLGQTVHNVTGLVTAKGPNGFWIAGDKVADTRISTGVYVFSSTVLDQVAVGDKISLSARVTEYRSKTAPNDLFLTELELPGNITVLSQNNAVKPVVLGKDRSPPTESLTPLDAGPDGFLSVPNNQTQLEAVNPTLQPEYYGLDFWESLEGQLVQIKKPVALGFGNNFGDFWVRGDWKVTGQNSRGGLTLAFGMLSPGPIIQTGTDCGAPTSGNKNTLDANPEAIIIGSPLDKSKNPGVALGTTLEDFTGVVTYQFGFYYILPTTALAVKKAPKTDAVKPTSLKSKPKQDCSITFGDYNVRDMYEASLLYNLTPLLQIENLAPDSAHLPDIANHISQYLKTPDIVFVQEVQDNSGPTNDGTVSANVTLTNLVNAIAVASGVQYRFVDIAPVDGKDGGIPGGNIRQAYLYNPDKLELAPGSPVGGSLDAVSVVVPPNKVIKLNYNPGRIDPTNEAWNSSRKPLVAQWQTPKGQKLFTINLHLASKGGSSSTQGNARPPVNSPLAARTSQISLVSSFVESVLSADKNANIIVAGDFNEFTQTRALFKPLTDVLTDIDEAAGIDPVERYSYVFDQNSQQLDHAFISKALKKRSVAFDHIHINTWAPSLAERISDHDPSVGQVELC